MSRAVLLDPLSVDATALGSSRAADGSDSFGAALAKQESLRRLWALQRSWRRPAEPKLFTFQLLFRTLQAPVDPALPTGIDVDNTKTRNCETELDARFKTCSNM